MFRFAPAAKAHRGLGGVHVRVRVAWVEFQSAHRVAMKHLDVAKPGVE